jgi:cytochrome c553
VTIRVSTLLYALGILVLAVPAGAVLVAWFGLYDVAASRGHWRITDLFLRFGMENSVRARAPDIQPPRLDNPDLIRLGAGHFHHGCAYCHGAPGIPLDPISQHMLPPPPDLKDKAGEWTDQELFQLIKHGLKYTGMPGWPAQQRDDEVWALVAFVRHLPSLDADGYRMLVLGGLRVETPGGRELATRDTSIDAAGACARCHGAEDRMPASALVPRLHGQPAEMLRAALDAFASDQRHSGIMQSIAAGLTPEMRQRLAQYYAGLPVPPPQGPVSVDAGLVERGRRLAADGDAAAQIPVCNGCHNAGTLPLYPRLAGQNAPYLANQLRLWRSGARGGNAETAAIMAPVAKRLDDQQINELAAYYASLSPQEAAASAPVRKAGEP